MCQNLEKQKLLLADVLQNRCSQKFYESLWKKPTLESHFNKTARPQKHPFLQNASNDSFWGKANYEISLKVGL